MQTPQTSGAFVRPARFSADEWEARVQLAAAYRIFDHLGWTELIYNHISLRVPDDASHYLINPFGLHYSEVCASNLVKVDLDGRIVGHSDWPINPAGITFHGAIHETLARRPLRHAPAHDGDASRLLPEGRPGVHEFLRRAALRQGRVSRLRGHHRARRRRRAHPEERRGPAGAAAAQPRAGDDRPHPAAGAFADVAGQPRLRDPAGDAGDGRADRRSRAPCSRSASPTRCSSIRSTAPARIRSPRCSGWSTAKDPGYRM